MTAVIVIAAVAAFIALTPVGAGVRYGAEGLRVRAYVWYIPIDVLKLLGRPKKVRKAKTPVKPGQPEKPAAASPAPEEKPPPAEKKPGLPFDIFAFPLKKALVKLARLPYFRRLRITFVSGGEPDKAAALYGKMWAAIGCVTPFVRLLRVRKPLMGAELDFSRPSPAIEADVNVQFRLGRVFGFGFWILFNLLKILKKKGDYNGNGESGKRNGRGNGRVEASC